MPRRPSWQPPDTPFTWAHVSALGVTRSMLHDAAKSGRITRLAHGVFVATSALADDPVQRHLQLALGHQLLRPRAIGSHDTAALAWGLDLDDPGASAAGRPRFIQPSGSGVTSQRSGAVRVHVRRLPQHHRTAHPSGLLITTVARTAVDVASEVDLPSALITLDSAARVELQSRVGSSRLRTHYTRAQSLAGARQPLLEAAAVGATLRNRASLNSLVAFADPRRESPLESYSFGQMVIAGLPLPELQVCLGTGNGELYPDFLWRRQRVIGEADGLVKYDRPEVLVREKRRQEQLEAMGFRVVRWDTGEIRRRPAAVLQRIAAALEERSV